MKPIKTFPNRSEFYAERGGAFSRERDFGVLNLNDLDGWQHRTATSGDDIRVAVVESTGDVYAQGGIGPDYPVALLGTIDTAACSDVFAEADTLLTREDDQYRLPLSWFMERLKCQAITHGGT